MHRPQIVDLDSGSFTVTLSNCSCQGRNDGRARARVHIKPKLLCRTRDSGVSLCGESRLGPVKVRAPRPKERLDTGVFVFLHDYLTGGRSAIKMTQCPRIFGDDVRCPLARVNSAARLRWRHPYPVGIERVPDHRNGVVIALPGLFVRLSAHRVNDDLIRTPINRGLIHHECGTAALMIDEGPVLRRGMVERSALPADDLEVTRPCSFLRLDALGLQIGQSGTVKEQIGRSMKRLLRSGRVVLLHLVEMPVALREQGGPIPRNLGEVQTMHHPDAPDVFDDLLFRDTPAIPGEPFLQVLCCLRGDRFEPFREFVPPGEDADVFVRHVCAPFLCRDKFLEAHRVILPLVVEQTERTLAGGLKDAHRARLIHHAVHQACQNAVRIAAIGILPPCRLSRNDCLSGARTTGIKVHRADCLKFGTIGERHDLLTEFVEFHAVPVAPVCLCVVGEHFHQLFRLPFFAAADDAAHPKCSHEQIGKCLRDRRASHLSRLEHDQADRNVVHQAPRHDLNETLLEDICRRCHRLPGGIFDAGVFLEP